MGKPDTSVHDAMERLSSEHYLGNIAAIACVVVKTDGQLEMAIGMPPATAYGLVAGLEILKHNVISRIIDQGTTPLKDSDI